MLGLVVRRRGVARPGEARRGEASTAWGGCQTRGSGLRGSRARLRRLLPTRAAQKRLLEGGHLLPSCPAPWESLRAKACEPRGASGPGGFQSRRSSSRPPRGSAAGVVGTVRETERERDSSREELCWLRGGSRRPALLRALSDLSRLHGASFRISWTLRSHVRTPTSFLSALKSCGRLPAPRARRRLLSLARPAAVLDSRAVIDE